MFSKRNKSIITTDLIYLYTKYQILSKLIISLVLFPIFAFLSNYLIKTTGRTNLSSGDFIGFFISIQGFTSIIIFLGLLLLIIGVDVNAFIIISALYKENKTKIRLKTIIIQSIKSLKHFFNTSGILIIVYMLIILPLLDLGISITTFKDFKIPNFITSVIFGNTIYSILYFSTLIFLMIFSFFHFFTLHYVIILKTNIKNSLRLSKQLVKNHWKSFFKDYILYSIKLLLKYGVLPILLIFLIAIILNSLNINTNIKDGIFIFSLLTIIQLISYLSFMSIPVSITLVTNMFYKYNEIEGNIIKFDLIQEDLTKKDIKKNPILIFIFIFLIFTFNIAVSSLLTIVPKDFFLISQKNISLVAHRAGGDLAAENSLEGVKEAIKANAEWTEIDVQRTKDGYYIINHDSTFKRLSNSSKKSSDMTYDEIKQLKIKDLFDNNRPSQPIPTLEEILDISKNKIGVFIELKGETADEEMVYDVIELVKQKEMINEVVLITLDYKLIEYIVANYPEVKTGYLYYFNLGNLKNLKGDYLIMEEREATNSKIDEIHQANKKAVVWTVNTDDSIKKFINSNADAIITDHIPKVKKAIDIYQNKYSKLDILIDLLLD